MQVSTSCRGLRSVVSAVLVVAACVSLAPPGRAGGPLLLSDPSARTPFVFTTLPAAVYTDLGTLGIFSNGRADSLTVAGYAQWSAVQSSSFEATVVGDLGALGLGDIVGANAASVIGTFNGGGIHVLYDHDGSILLDVFGAPPGVLGISSPEYAQGNAILESWVVLAGPAIAAADTTGASFSGVFVHEFGHSINLAHSQTNGAMLFFGDDGGPGPCPTPFVGFPMAAEIETMYPFIDALPDGTGPFVATVDHLDDVTALSDLYPSGNWPGSQGTITGTLFDLDGLTGLTGINVIARNVLAPFSDAVSAITGDYTQGELGPDGLYTLTGLTPGASYVLYIDQLVAGGFSTPPGVLGAEEEYWNLGEAGDRVSDPSCDSSLIVAGRNDVFVADLYANVVPPPTPAITPPSVQLIVPEGELEYFTLTVSNDAPVGADDLVWTTTDRPVFARAVRTAGEGPRTAPGFQLARARAAGADEWLTEESTPSRLRAAEEPAPRLARRLRLQSTLGGLLDGSFELGGVWNEFSSNFGSPVCDLAVCGSGTGTGPRSGARWAWFGGLAGGLEQASVSQQVVIPAGGATLTFYLEQVQCDSAADRLEVLVDGVPVFLSDGAAPACGQLGYALRTVDLGAYADGGVHTLEFRTETSSVNGGVTNFFVDDIDIVASTCPWLFVFPQSGVLAPGESEVLDLAVNPDGLAAGSYRCELLLESNAGPEALVVVPIDLDLVGSVLIDARTVAPARASVFTAPDGSGRAFTEAFAWDGAAGSPATIVDATIVVTIRDLSGAPVAGFPARAIQLRSTLGGLQPCPADTTADGDTDAEGRAYFRLPRRAGGTTDALAEEVLQVELDGAFVADAVYGDEVLYGSDRDGRLFVIDTVTGTGSFTCTLPSDATEIEYDKTTGQAWVQDNATGFTARRFAIADCAEIGSGVFNGAEFNALEYIGAELYGVSSPSTCSNSSLRILDPATGSVVVLGPTGKGPIAGLAWDRATSTLFGVTGCSQSVPTELVTLNLFTGAATTIGLTGVSLGSLQFGPDGELYAGGDERDGGNLYRLDRLTGQATLVGPTGFASVTGLTLYSPYGIDVQFNSADLAPDGVVDLADLGVFASAYASAYSYQADFRWDGKIDLADAGLFSSALGGACGTPPLVDPLPAPNVLGIEVAQDGRPGTLVLERGRWAHAQLVLRGPAAEAGVRAWSGRISATGNVELDQWQLPEGSLNLRPAPEFLVGHGTQTPRGDRTVLLSLRVRVLDDAPARIWVAPLEGNEAVQVALSESDPDRSAVHEVTTQEARLNSADGPEAPSTPFRGLRLRAAPNPFNPVTTFSFDLPRAGRVALDLYDARGRLVRSLGPDFLEAGPQHLRWDGLDDHGEGVHSGVYLGRLRLDGDPIGDSVKVQLVK